MYPGSGPTLVRGANERRMAVNRKMWDEAVPLHLASPFYDVPGFLRGASTLLPFEVAGMGPVRGRSLLHLQCHIGLDTLSWARRGARVTGVDYSAPAIAAARRLARATRLPARFVRSDLYSVPRHLSERFDVVYTGKGALCWLPDLPRWAGVIARMLRPGGRLYYAEDHPYAEMLESEPTGFVVRAGYFRRRPLRYSVPETYATTAAHMRNATKYEWIHPVSEALRALRRAGLEVEEFTEYPFSLWPRYPRMRVDPEGHWRLPRAAGSFPLMYSVRARRHD